MAGKEDIQFLQTLQHMLMELMKHYGASNYKELESQIVEEAKKSTGSLTMQKKIEFLSLLHEVLDAYHLAEEKHREQKRKSGEPYIVHPLYVALNEMYHQEHVEGRLQESPIIAALLHDTVEDTDTSFSEITERFGSKVGGLVEHLTKNPKWSDWKKAGELSSSEQGALQFLKAKRDEDALSIKYQDRLHNLETIRFMPEKKRILKLLETCEVGFIEHAEEQAMWYFLIQLYITLKTYATDDAISAHHPEPKLAIEIRDKAVQKIKGILRTHQQDFFHGEI